MRRWTTQVGAFPGTPGASDRTLVKLLSEDLDGGVDVLFAALGALLERGIIYNNQGDCDLAAVDLTAERGEGDRRPDVSPPGGRRSSGLR